jgi:hypothetical protein
MLTRAGNEDRIVVDDDDLTTNVCEKRNFWTITDHTIVCVFLEKLGL